MQPQKPGRPLSISMAGYLIKTCIGYISLVCSPPRGSSSPVTRGERVGLINVCVKLEYLKAIFNSMFSDYPQDYLQESRPSSRQVVDNPRHRLTILCLRGGLRSFAGVVIKLALGPYKLNQDSILS